jgi:hypothetical protein
MTIRYYIAVEDPTGLVTDLIQNPLSFSYGLGFSRRNVLQLRLSGYDNLNIPPDSMLRLWRRDIAISDTWRNVGNFIFKTYDRSLAESGLKSTAVWGASPEELVAKAIIAYPSGTPQTSKSGDVAQVVAEFVRENSGTDALLANGRYIDHNTGMIVPTPAGAGILWTGARAGKPLLEVCQEIVNYSRLNGVRLDFRVDYSGGVYTFRVGILGTDRTATGVNPSTGLNGAGNAPVIISPLLENMRSYNDVLARMNESNVVFALGSGQQSDRLTATAVDVASAGLSALAHRESVISATSETASGLVQRAEAALEERVGRRNFVSNPDPTRVKLFLDYNVGDLVTVETEDGERFDRQVITADINVSLSGNGFVEQYTLEFDDV